MYIPDELKLNKFREVALLSPHDFFLRFGGSFRSGVYCGEESFAQMPQSKLTAISSADAIDQYYQRMEAEEAARAAASSNTSSDSSE